MSKDQKKTISIDVEIVDNWSKTLTFCTSTLTFWKLDNKWPTNLVCDALNEISNKMYEMVSSSHIIDK